jgi:hypothetical protein
VTHYRAVPFVCAAALPIFEATLELKFRPYTPDPANESGHTAGEVLGFSRV